MQSDLIREARRQAEICNACRYCEGYCYVFPSLHSQRAFSDGDITQLANLCHNCRGCYYACQYTAPHEFDLNLPRALAEVRRDSWQTYVWPGRFAALFHSSGTAIAFALVFAFAAIFLVMNWLGAPGGDGFYAAMAHNVMVAIFLPAFLFPLLSIGIGLRRYWRAVDGQPVTITQLSAAMRNAASMKDLAAGHGDGCNFEDDDRFSHSRRIAHQLVMYGFLLCFASTSAGTVLHYLFALPAPYDTISLPKAFGVPGGILLTLGCIWMVRLKWLADKNLGDPKSWGGDVAFILLLGFVAFSGLALYAFGQTDALRWLLAIHLGAVLAFFLLTPFTKMAHVFFRLSALVRDSQRD